MSDVILIEPNIFDVPVNPLFFKYEELLKRWSFKKDLIGFSRGTIVPPTSLISMATYLNKSQISVEIIDLTLLYMTEKENLLNRTLSLLKEQKPKIIGISGMYLSLIPSIKKLALQIKDILPESKLVVGGVSACYMKNDLLENGGFDFVVRGEGEINFLNLCKNILSIDDASNLQGISYLENGHIRDCRDRKFMNLKKLHIPDRDLYPISKFYEFNQGIDVTYASRGCPYECTFCSSPSFWKKIWRAREPQDVVNELIDIRNKGAKIVHLYDANFGVSRKWIKEICIRINENELDIFWDCSMRLDFIDPEMLKMMYDSNCRSIFIGIEASSQKVLNSVKKKYKNMILFEKLETAKETGIQVECGIIIGLPEDSETTITETTELVLELYKSDLVQTPGYFLFVPWIGTYIGDNLDQFGIKIASFDYENWNCFSPKPVVSTKHITAHKVYELWNKGLEKICQEISLKLDLSQ